MISPFSKRPAMALLAAFALLLAAANLRGGIVVVGPLVESIRADLQLSASAFSLLTTVPLLCFAVVSIFVPFFARAFRPQSLVVGALLLVSLGVLLRVTQWFPVILVGTVFLGSAIALLNVLIPGLVKAFFPNHLGLMTGLYSVTLSLGAGFGVFLAVPLLQSFGSWRYPMLLWAALPILSILLWLPLFKERAIGRPANPLKVTLWRDKTAWAITVYMGLQSFLFYSLATWLPKIYMESGLSSELAGQATALINLLSIPFNLFVPIIAAKLKQQFVLVWLISGFIFAGLLGLLLAPGAYPMLWSSLIGMGVGGSLALALTLFVLRAHDIHQATALSAMAQSLGYLLAASGPFLLGFVHDISHQWQAALYLLLALQCVQLLAGLYAAKPSFVKSD